MIFEELSVKKALGHLLQELQIMPPEGNGKADRNFYDNLYWQAQIYTFLDPDAWVGVRRDKIVRQRIDEKLHNLKTNLMRVVHLERNAHNRDRINKMIANIEDVDSENGFLSEVISSISKLNAD